jgi:tetratricopeptide (TPR) repeat protein/transcriptional regulator with XRE-family HTH domain
LVRLCRNDGDDLKGHRMVTGSAEFGRLMASHRQAAGLSQAELAERAGMSVRAISNLERGRTLWPHPDSVHRLAGALRLTAADRAVFEAAAGRRLAAAGNAAGGQGTRRFPASAVPVTPRRLPGAVRQFTGRKSELSLLTGLLDQAAVSEPPAATIALIAGMAGVGKTALAVRWAHQAARRFPGGQLYADLHGYDPSALPVPAGDALAGFLRALGVPGPDIPDTMDERAAAYRSLLASKRVLVVLDNARDVDQVRPLLPGDPGCMTVVTSRDALGGLVAGDGARRLTLDPLPLPEAVDLLGGLIGGRVADDPDAAARLAHQCGRLPLALRVAAELAATRGCATLADLTSELADMRHRLEVLQTGGDQRTTVRAVFTWSYQDLNPAAAGLFRLLGLQPGPDIAAPAAARLAGLPLSGARRAIGQLTRAHLVQEQVPDRFSCHDLIRLYAAEQAAAHDDEPRRSAALTRLLGYYLSTAVCAVDLLYPAGPGAPPRPPGPPPAGAGPAPAVRDRLSARAWLDAERANLTAAAGYAARNGLPGYAIGLSTTLFFHLDYGAHFPEAQAIHSAAALAATAAQDRQAQAHALINLAGVALRQSRTSEAAGHYRQALALCRDCGDRFGELRARASLASVEQRESRYQQAAGHYRQVLQLCRDLGIRTHEIRVLTALGQIDLLRGLHDQAAAGFRQAVDLCQEAGDHNSRADALLGLAEVDLHQGRYPQARARLAEARAVYADTGNQSSDVHALYYLGLLELREGHHQQAASLLQSARAAFRDRGDRADEANALYRLAELDLLLRRHRPAMDKLRQVLELARPAGNRIGEAMARNALGEALLTAGCPGEARTAHQDALRLATQIGVPGEQDRARRGLAAVAACG